MSWKSRGHVLGWTLCNDGVDNVAGLRVLSRGMTTTTMKAHTCAMK